MKDFNMEDLYPGEFKVAPFNQKAFDELSERANEHQLMIERLWGENSGKLLEEVWAEQQRAEQEFLKAETGNVTLQINQRGGKSVTLSLQAIAECARKFGEAVKHKAPVFVVTADCLAMHPELQEIASGLGGSIITSEEMPKPDNTLEAAVKAITHAQMPVYRGCHKHATQGGRTSKGDRRRKRQQWHRPKGTN